MSKKTRLPNRAHSTAPAPITARAASDRAIFGASVMAGTIARPSRRARRRPTSGAVTTHELSSPTRAKPEIGDPVNDGGAGKGGNGEARLDRGVSRALAPYPPSASFAGSPSRAPWGRAGGGSPGAVPAPPPRPGPWPAPAPEALPLSPPGGGLGGPPPPPPGGRAGDDSRRPVPSPPPLTSPSPAPSASPSPSPASPGSRSPR